MTARFRPCVVLGIAMSAVVASGCASVAKLPAAANVVPAQWSGNVAPQNESAQPVDSWPRVFNDPVLDALIQKALARNSDLKTAEARVREARAQRSVATSNLLPHVDANAFEQRSLSSKLLRQPKAAPHQELYDAGFDASWEIDLFGQTRHAIRGAAANAAAEEAARDGVRVTVVAEVARNYFELRGAQTQRDILREMLRSQQETVTLTENRFNAGTAKGVEVTLARGQVEAAAARTPLVDQQIQRATTALAVLTTEPADAVRLCTGEHGAAATAYPDVRIGVPSEVLRGRPDIRQAERVIERSANAVGVAVGDLFPRITILGSGGVSGSGFSALDSLGNRYWKLGPSVDWPILDIGRVLGNIRVQRARHEQALHQYEKAVLLALKDVEDSMVSCREEQARLRSLSNAVGQYDQALTAASALYASGVKDYLYVLEAQRALLDARISQAACNATCGTTMASLYKALGGAWGEAPAEAK